MKLKFKLLGFPGADCEVGMNQFLERNQVFDIKGVGMSVNPATGWITVGVVYEEKEIPS